MDEGQTVSDWQRSDRGQDDSASFQVVIFIYGVN